jgi:predicted RNA-binding Zn ribbon-like protein
MATTLAVISHVRKHCYRENVTATTDELAVAFANTAYAIRGRPGDEIGTPHGLLAWLRGHGHAVERADAGTVEAFLALRAAVRELFRAVVDEAEPPADALAAVNAAAAAAPAAVTLDWTGSERAVRVARRGDPVTAAKAELAAAAVSLLGGASGDELRACGGPRCIQYLLQDRPRRAFCSDGCSTRARAARYYERHREPRVT